MGDKSAYYVVGEDAPERELLLPPRCGFLAAFGGIEFYVCDRSARDGTVLVLVVGRSSTVEELRYFAHYFGTEIFIVAD